MRKKGFKETEIGKIPEDWEVKHLSELTLNITDGKHGDCRNQENSGYYFISCKDINDKHIQYENAREITKEDFEDTHRRTKLEVDDILLTNSGTIGRIAICLDQKLASKTTFQKSVAILKPRRELILPEFLYYSLFFNVKRLIETSGGTTQKNLLLKDIRSFTISICDLEEQQAIVKILSDLDTKIEINLQMNATLERMAGELFKCWFVNFESPDEEGKPYRSSGGKMVESELGKIPKGWNVGSLDDIADFLNGLALQKFPPKNDREYLPVIKIRELRQGITDTSDRASLNIPAEYVVDDGDILFSWSGSLEVTLWCGGKGALNQHLFKVTSPTYPKWFYYYWVLRYLPEYRRIAEGKATTMGHIQRHHLTSSRVLIPDSKTLLRMSAVLNPVLEEITNIRVESKRLNEMRDLLLPKLMSGEIRVMGR